MKKHNKKGFTLVELLVVIAILAVLASVSVVGYLSFVKKSKVSNDTSLITQMNTVLASNEVMEGKNDTPYDAITELKDEAGFDLNKITPTTEGYYYAFDASKNRIFLLDDKCNQVAPENLSISSIPTDLFVLVSNEDEITTATNYNYSSYLKDGFTWKDNNSNKEITTSKGIDVGNNVASEINYTAENDYNVLIRTNSFDTTLNVNTTGTVSHYGKLLALNVEKVAMHSYHEFGRVKGKLALTEGKVNLEENSSVGSIEVKASSADKVEVVVSENADLRYMYASANEDVLTNMKTTGEVTKVYTNGIGSNVAYGLDTKEFYSTLNDSINKSKNFVLIADITLNEKITIDDKTLDIDLNGKTISRGVSKLNDKTEFSTASSDPAFWIKNGSYVNFFDSVGGGKVICKSTDNARGAAVNINNNNNGSVEDKVSTVVLNGGTFEGGYAGSYVFFNGKLLVDGASISGSTSGVVASSCGSVVEIYSGEMKSDGYGIAANGSGNGNRDPYIINVYGGKISGATGIYHSNAGVLNIYDGEIAGSESGVETRAGNTNIYGGLLKSSATKYEYKKNGYGTTTIGAALAVVQHNTKKDIAVNIHGGTFEGIKSLIMNDIQENNSTNVTVTIYSGTFNGGIMNSAEKWTFVDKR